MKWNEEEDKKKPFLAYYIKVFVRISPTLSLCFLCSYSFIFMHTHTHRTHDKKSVLLSTQKKEWFWFGNECSYEFAWKKCKKVFARRPLSKFGLLFFLHAQRKKRSPFCALWSSKKKSFRRWDERSSLLTFYTTSHHDGSLFFDSGSAREQSRFCKQGTIHERHYALCRLFFPRSFFYCCCFVRARASYGRVRVR